MGSRGNRKHYWRDCREFITNSILTMSPLFRDRLNGSLEVWMFAVPRGKIKGNNEARVSVSYGGGQHGEGGFTRNRQSALAPPHRAGVRVPCVPPVCSAPPVS